MAAFSLALSQKASAELVADVDTLAYSTIPKNSESTLLVIIKNTSTTQNVTEVVTEINGKNSNFYFSLGCGTTLLPLEECELLVTFKAPDHPGKSKRTLTVSGNESLNQVSADVTLEGYAAK
jgi:hypothetical protein